MMYLIVTNDDNINLGITILVKLGCGGRFGWQLSPISSALSLVNTRLSMKKRLPLLKLTLTRLLKNAMLLLLSTKGMFNIYHMD